MWQIIFLQQHDMLPAPSWSGRMQFCTGGHHQREYSEQPSLWPCGCYAGACSASLWAYFLAACGARRLLWVKNYRTLLPGGPSAHACKLSTTAQHMHATGLLNQCSNGPIPTRSKAAAYCSATPCMHPGGPVTTRWSEFLRPLSSGAQPLAAIILNKRGFSSSQQPWRLNSELVKVNS